MTVPGGVANLPQGALTLDTLASNLQDMSGDAMKNRAVERFPSIMDSSTGLSPALDITPFGILTRIWAEVNSLIANADPADITGPGDIPELLLEFIEGLPVIGTFVGLVEAILGTYDGDDTMLLTIQSIFEPIRKFFQLITGITSGFPDIGQLLSGDASGFFDITGITGTLTGLADAAQGTVDGIVNSILGLFGSHWPQAAANTALEAQASAVAATAAALAQIQAGQNQGNTGGLNALVDFTTFSNSADLPSVFTETYTGSGTTGHYGVASGQGATTTPEAFNTARGFIGEYNVADTITDYQRVGAVWTGSPGISYQNPTPFFLPTPYFGAYRGEARLYCRYKDVNNWVRVRFRPGDTVGTSGDALLENCVSGTITLLDSVGHGFLPNSAYWLEAGFGASARTFRIIAGTTVIRTYTDPGTSTQMGSAFRGAAIGGLMLGAQGAGVPANAAPQIYFAVQDNSPAGVVGSGARLFLASTTPVTVNGVTPNSFFDITEYLTDEYTYTAGSGSRVTVSKTDWYVVSAHMTWSGGTSATRLNLYRNGVLVRQSDDATGANMKAGSWVIYLQAGDYVQIGTNASQSVTGTADGTGTCIEITRTGRVT